MLSEMDEGEGEKVAGDTKPRLFHLYIDDTGSRQLDKLAKTANEHPRWFGLGGILIREEDEQSCRELFEGLKARWPSLTEPLHITDMRAKRKHFSWLDRLSAQELTDFWSDYHQFLGALPVTGIACVVDRPGYLGRGYGSRVGDAKWNLCKTAFNILIERAGKLAARDGRRLRVKYEGSDRQADQALRGYFALLKAAHGLQFDAERAAKYGPMPPAELAAVLIDLERKDKRSKLMQIADSYIYAMAKGGYEPSFTLYAAIQGAGRLVDSALPDELRGSMGIKYSCFDHLTAQTAKAGVSPGP
jgi:hypothetical protein